MDKVWVIEDPDNYLKQKTNQHRSVPPDGKNKPTRIHSSSMGKNPAWAYTLSMLWWGAGQYYNEDYGKSLRYHLIMMFMLIGTVIAVIFREHLLLFLQNCQIPFSQYFLFGEIAFFTMLVFWISVSGDAYRVAASSRSIRFTGIESRVYPCLCSLIFPGWGQFLNGQPIKGAFFSGLRVFGIFAIISIPLTLLAWPYLEASRSRFVVEAVFAITVLYAPLIPFVWLLSIYDALKVSLDDLKKESFLERTRAANNRRLRMGWIRGIFPQIRSTLVLMVVLIALLLSTAHIFPVGFYTGLLVGFSEKLSSYGMIILPEIMDFAVPLIAQTGR
jgi:TM2 domain-containing membrane protein YozV